MSDGGDSPLDDLVRVARGWRWTRRNLLADAPSAQPYDSDWARSPIARAVREAGLGRALGPLLGTALQVSVAGQERLERAEPPVIFVANHASHLDALLVLRALPPVWRRRTLVAAAADYFFDRWWRSALSALVLNAVPLTRHAGIVDTQHEFARLVDAGWSVLAFPEGTRSRDGSLQRFHHGASRLALDTGRPVVPIAIRGTFAAMPVGQRWPTRGAVHARFGDALRPSPGERTRDLTARIRDALERALLEDSTTWWTALRAQRAQRAEHAAPSSSSTSPCWRRVWSNTAPLSADNRPPVWPR